MLIAVLRSGSGQDTVRTICSGNTAFFLDQKRYVNRLHNNEAENYCSSVHGARIAVIDNEAQMRTVSYLVKNVETASHLEHVWPFGRMYAWPS